MNDRALDAAMRYGRAGRPRSTTWVWDDLAIFERAWRRGTLSTRISARSAVDVDALRDRIARRDLGADGRGDAWLRIGALKGFVDGSLGSHTAAFIEPFSDAPQDRGLFVNSPDDLYAWVAGADQAGLQVAIHAIGDRANQTLLDIYARVAAEHGPRDRRFRIEHAQHLAPADVARFGQPGIPSKWPIAIDDGRGPSA
jgi:predicted amidohydrolase YtcJ